MQCQQRPSSQQCLPHSVLKSWWPIPASVFPPTFHWTPQKMCQRRKQFGWAHGGQRREGLRLWGCILHVLAPSSSWGSWSLNLCGKRARASPPAVGTASKQGLVPRGPQEPAGMGKARVAQGRAAPSTGPVLLQSLEPLPWQQPSHVLLSLAVLHPVSCAVRAHLSQGLSSPN